MEINNLKEKLTQSRISKEVLSNSLPPVSSLAVTETGLIALAITAYLADPLGNGLTWVIGAITGSIAVNQIANRMIEKEKAEKSVALKTLLGAEGLGGLMKNLEQLTGEKKNAT
jgi:hypothetical protein